MGSNRITVLILLIFSFCLKAKKSPFDVSSQSGSATTALVSGVKISTVASGTNSTSTTTPTTNTPTTATIPAPPSNLVYTVTALQSKLIPGNTTVISPTITGTVSSWTISPSTLPPGVTFDATTGVITCSPPVGSAPFPLTNFTVTAINPGGNTTFTVPLQVLGTGENVWTVISGVSGQDVGVNAGSLVVDNTSISTSLFLSGNVMGNMDGVTSPAPANQALFISKYSLDGTRSWTQMLGVAGADTIPQGTRMDASGNVYLSGYTQGNLDGNTLVGSANLFVSKYNTNGTKQWTKLRGNASTFGNAIAVDGSANSYVTGYKNGSSLDSFSHPNGGNSLFIVKHNTNGIWQGTDGLATSPGGDGIEGYGIAISPNGNIIVAGMTKTTTRCGTTNAIASSAIFIFNSSMSYSTCGSVNGTGSFGFGIAIDSSNNIYVAGYFTSTTFDGISKNSSGSNNDAYLIKFNSSGIRQWTKVYGVAGATNTKAYAITLSGSNIYITGETSGNLNGETLNGTQDMFIMKYDLLSDTVKWTKLIGAAGAATVGQGVTFDSNNTMYGAGTTTGDLGGTTNPTKPKQSLFITRFVQ